MQISNKQQILKLLNLDTIISDYLNQPKLNRKIPANNYQHKIIYRNIENNQKHNTLDMATSNKRNQSTHNFGRNNVKYTQLNTKNQNIMKKNYSGRTSCRDTRKDKDNQIKTQYKSINSKACKSTKIFKQTNLFDSIYCDNKNRMLYQTNYNVSKHRNLQSQTTKVQDSFNLFDPIIQDQSQQKTNSSKSQIKLKQNSNPDPKIGLTLKGRYKLQKVIGRGLSGLVYKAKDVLSQRNVAIKIIEPTNIQYEFIKQIQHPNIISYYNSFTQNNKRYIVLEYLPHSLAEIVRKRRLTEEQVKKIFKSVVSGLMYLHSLSYAHRDIKLDNIVTNQDFSLVKFIDFGLCLDTHESDVIQKKRFCGTTSYIAPQVIQGTCRQPKKADIWSLGVALYVLSVGRTPFHGRQQIDIFNKIKSNKTIFPVQMPQKLKNLLQKMLLKNPDQRPTIYDVINNCWITS